MLPMYYLQLGCIAEALHAYTSIKDSFADNTGMFSEPGSIGFPLE